MPAPLQNTKIFLAPASACTSAYSGSGVCVSFSTGE